MEITMKGLKLLSAAALLTAVLPLSTSSSLAAGRGPGPCTPPGSYAVGAEGPALSGGQWMAGVGQCRHTGSWDSARHYWRRGGYDNGYGYGYGAPGWGATAYGPDY
jgi:hypothetical protein